MNENINLCKILKDCPKGTKLYSTLYGNVKLKEISEIDYDGFPIKFSNDVTSGNVTKEGKHYYTQNDECTLFPAKDQEIGANGNAPNLSLTRRH